MDPRGVGPAGGFYEAADGWVCVQARGDGACVGAGAEGLVAKRTCAEAIAVAEAAGLQATRTRPASEVLRDPALRGAGAFHIRTAEDVSAFMVNGRHAAFGRTWRRAR
ncbi:hypothetical protein [Actinomadura harenae]|uniref:Uncharacterized protein n=1 Tax=Actinomadura harenae TaxID=2483351 RepID=A0A3M2M6W9_9ACTN|nr:hypothetical protein [Actinomadura harenae]RMI45447.1 hypothetical protein EBO15_09535 [Actinomadura harenae]